MRYVSVVFVLSLVLALPVHADDARVSFGRMGGYSTTSVGVDWGRFALQTLDASRTVTADDTTTDIYGTGEYMVGYRVVDAWTVGAAAVRNTHKRREGIVPTTKIVRHEERIVPVVRFTWQRPGEWSPRLDVTARTDGVLWDAGVTYRFNQGGLFAGYGGHPGLGSGFHIGLMIEL